MKQNLMLLFLMTLINSCSNDNTIVTPKIENNAFAIYFLKDTTLTMKNIFNTDLKDLVLADDPWLSQDDIDFYDWSSHCIYLKKDKSFLFPNYQFYYLFPKSWMDLPYIVTVNNKRCYIGYFSTQSSTSEYPLLPYIDMLDVGLYPADILHSNWIFLYVKDTRDNKDVKENLIEIGLLHRGLSVELGDSLWLKNSDTATIKYKLKITNNDKDNLLFLDPYKTGTELFHYYNNGPEFMNKATKRTYISKYKTIKGPANNTGWKPEWFTIIEAGRTIERNIELKGYPRFPEGEYVFQLKFNCPIAIAKEERTVGKNRYWIGDTFTEMRELSFNDNKNKLLENRINPNVDWETLIKK